MARKKIGAMLEEKGYINEFQLVAALSHQRKWKTKLGQSLIELGYLDEGQLFEVLADQLQMEFVDLRKVEIPAEALRRVNKDYAREWQAIPVNFEAGNWKVATSDPDRIGLAENLFATLGGKITLVLATPMAIEAKLRKIPDKVQVAAVQPVKKAFVRDENGVVTPAAPPPAPETKDDSSVNFDISLDELGPPPPAPGPGTPSPAVELEEELLEETIEAPEIIQSQPGEGSMDLLIEAPPLVVDEAIPLEENGENEIRLEAAHETQATITESEPPPALAESEIIADTDSETPGPGPAEPVGDELVGLDDLLPPPLPAEASSPDLPPGLTPDRPELTVPSFDEPFEDKPLDIPSDSEIAAPSDVVDEELIEAPPLSDLLSTSQDRKFAEEEKAPPPPSEEEMAPALELDLPPAPPVDELFEESGVPPLPGDFEAPLSAPHLASVPPAPPPASENSEEIIEELPPLEDMAELGAAVPEPAEPPPTLDELIPPLLETETAETSAVPEIAFPEISAPPLEPPALEAPSLMPPEKAPASAKAVPPPAAPVAAKPTPPPVAPPSASAAGAPDREKELEPPATSDEDTATLMERIGALESQIQGMTSILGQFKEVLQDKQKGKKK